MSLCLTSFASKLCLLSLERIVIMSGWKSKETVQWRVSGPGGAASSSSRLSELLARNCVWNITNYLIIIHYRVEFFFRNSHFNYNDLRLWNTWSHHSLPWKEKPRSLQFFLFMIFTKYVGTNEWLRPMSDVWIVLAWNCLKLQIIRSFSWQSFNFSDCIRVIKVSHCVISVTF